MTPEPTSEEIFALPVSFSQQMLWFLHQLEPNNSAYNIPIALRLSGALDIAALEKCFDAIIARHEILRTTFAVIGDRPMQVVRSPQPFCLTVTSLEALSPAEKDARIQAMAAAEAYQSFDLVHGPLISLKLLRLDPQAHVLLLTMHHIVSDNWSIGVFVREVAALYQAYAKGVPSPLANLPIQYADYAIWQREMLQGEVFETQLNYWKQQLSGYLPILELPLDKPRPAVQSYKGGNCPFNFPRNLLDDLLKLGRQEGATLFMVLLAAFQALLYRYSGQEDIWVGSPIANRTRSEMEGLIGYFVNMLVLRSDFSGNPTFRELLGQVLRMTLDAYAHQDLPFEKLVEELQPNRDMSFNPLFQACLVLQNASVNELKLPGLVMEPLSIGSKASRFDLTFSVEENEQGLCGVFEYSSDLFYPETAARMVKHLKNLLIAAIANPDCRISDLAILDQAERDKILCTFNDVGPAYPAQACLHELFESQVARTPDAPGVSCGDNRLTYDQLNRKANQLAHYLQGLGVGPESIVGICVERSPDMVVGILGILKAGGAYVPLDPWYPEERLAYILEDFAKAQNGKIPILLSQTGLASNFPGLEARVIYLDSDWEAIQRESEENPQSGVLPENLAYIIYTSGSTGRPKGVTLTHANICPLLYWGYEAKGLTAKDRTLQYLSYCFDWSVWEIFITLTSGATLYLLPAGQFLNPLATIELLEREAITVLHTTPTQLQILLNQGKGLGKLKYLCIGAEKVTMELVEKAHTVLPADCRIFNHYGPTEDTILAAVSEADRQNLSRYQDLTSLPIGIPVANGRCYVLDRFGNPQPIGVPGELFLWGEGLARGYLNRPDLTADRFVPDFISGAPGARLYRTGDLARYLPDGSLEYLGRLDHQVKIRGFRIELGEIESTLLQYPSIREAIVLARPDNVGQNQLVAYVVPQTGANPGMLSDLRTYLKERLPEYMLPSVFVLLEAMPVSPNGKTDRKALPAPDNLRPDMVTEYIAPSTPLECQIAEIWQNALNVERVGVNDNFFELGGHSLLVIEVLGQLKAALQREISAVDLFRFPTIQALAEHLSEQPGDAADIERSLDRGESRREALRRRKHSRHTGDQDD
ncbi:MAG: non-ribosomal peptide synthetase [Chloroflexota bacterium]